MNWKLKGNLGSACVDYKNLIGQQDFMFDKQKCNCLTCWSTYHLNHDETDNHLGGWITDTKLNGHFVWGIYLEPMKYHPIRRFWICIHYVRTKFFLSVGTPIRTKIACTLSSHGQKMYTPRYGQKILHTQISYGEKTPLDKTIGIRNLIVLTPIIFFRHLLQSGAR